MRKKASEIKGRNLQLYETKEDVKHLTERHKLPRGAKGVITIGNDDCPDEIWFTHDKVPNHMSTTYTKLKKRQEVSDEMGARLVHMFKRIWDGCAADYLALADENGKKSNSVKGIDIQDVVASQINCGSPGADKALESLYNEMPFEQQGEWLEKAFPAKQRYNY